MIEIDGYADIERIGQGGLGDVYRATRVSTGGTVAIKVLRDVSDESVVWHRTRRELTALVALAGHGNVIQLLEMLDLAEGPALVMEYAPGGSVAGLLRARDATLAVGEVVMIGRHTAAALVAAHEQGIVHRDIKPQNLLIDAYGQVKLCDFGVAALTRSDDFRTRTNALSMRYASPEDLDDEVAIGPASDVYSLGATLLHLAHGAPPTLKERLAPWVAPPTDDADLESLDEIIASCLRPEPIERPSATVVLDRLEQLDRILDDRRRSLPAIEPEPTAVMSPEPRGASMPATVVPAEIRSDPTRSEDTTVYRAGRRPPPGPATEPTGRSRVPIIAGGLIIAAVVTGGAAFAWWPDDSGRADDRRPVITTEPTDQVLDPVTSVPPSSAPPSETDRPDATIVRRPGGLTPIDDPSIVWPFGDPAECLVQQAGLEVLQVVDCAEPHDLQRYAVAELDTDRYPTDAPYDAGALRDAVLAACSAAFEPFAGMSADETVFDLPFTLPSEATWADGDRRYQCFLGVAGARTTGDATGATS